jgi:hypothetical protein
MRRRAPIINDHFASRNLLDYLKWGLGSSTLRVLSGGDTGFGLAGQLSIEGYFG